MNESLEIFRKAMIKGYKIEELRKKYEEQVSTIKKKFPKESAQRILKGLTFKKFVQNMVSD